MQKKKNHLIKRITEVICKDKNFPLIMLALSFFSFGVLLPTLGLYSDDWHYFWLSYRLDYIQRFFYHNRPYLGVVYDLFTNLIPPSALAWHIILFLLKWSAAVWLWQLFKHALFDHLPLAKWICLIFIFYPGNLILFQPLLFTVAVIQLNLYFFSLWLCIRAGQQPGKHIVLTIFSMITAIANLIASEYFFFLELLRPVFLWLAIRPQEKNRKMRLKRTLASWLPYLVMFIFVLVWRYFYQSQLTSQQPWVLNEFIQEPIRTLLDLLKVIGNTIYQIFVTAWHNPVLIDQIYEPNALYITLYFMALVVLSFGFLVFLFRSHKKLAASGNFIYRLILLTGLIALLLGGLPVWLAKFNVDLGFRAENRFILPFILGVSLSIAGSSFLCFKKNTTRTLFLSTAVALGIGFQFLTANLYRQEWNQLKEYYWQMYWRIPQMQTGIHLVTNQPPLAMEGENSLSAAINWVYGKNQEKKQIDYYLYFMPERMQDELGDLIKNKSIQIGHQIGDFSGKELKVLTYVFSPPACLRILDPTLEENNLRIPSFVTSATKISDLSMISPQTSPANQQHILQLFGNEPASNWCYFYEKADLARQFGKWEEVISLYQQAEAKGQKPSDDVEWLPLIEASVHLGDWETALMYSREVHEYSNDYQPLLCSLWNRIKAEVLPSGPELNLFDEHYYTELKCNLE